MRFYCKNLVHTPIMHKVYMYNLQQSVSVFSAQHHVPHRSRGDVSPLVYQNPDVLIILPMIILKTKSYPWRSYREVRSVFQCAQFRINMSRTWLCLYVDSMSRDEIPPDINQDSQKCFCVFNI